MTTASVFISRLRFSNNGDLREVYGLCSKMTPFDIEEGIKIQIQHLEKSFRP